MSEALTKIEQGTLQAFESVIEKGLASFVEVGNALMRIRDSKLYRGSHDTFEAYCIDRWKFTRQYANQLVRSAEAVKAIEEVETIVSKPANEAQARPLTKLDSPAEQVAAWEQVIETAPKDEEGEPIITAKHVESVVREHLSESEPEESRPAPKASGPTQWDRLNDGLEKSRQLFDQIVSERRENPKSDAVLNLYESLVSAVSAYRKSVSRHGG